MQTFVVCIKLFLIKLIMNDIMNTKLTVNEVKEVIKEVPERY